MGARLVSVALLPDWAGLSAPARLGLVAMCQTAHDRACDDIPAGTYWGGHAALAVALFGGDGPSELRRVRRIIAELVEAGAVELVEPAHRRRQATYRVTPDNFHAPLA